MDQNTLFIIVAALLAISEVIALTPLKSNSVFQLIVSILKMISGKRDQAQ